MNYEWSRARAYGPVISQDRENEAESREKGSQWSEYCRGGHFNGATPRKQGPYQ